MSQVFPNTNNEPEVVVKVKLICTSMRARCSVRCVRGESCPVVTDIATCIESICFKLTKEGERVAYPCIW